MKKIYAVFLLLSVFSINNVNAQNNNQWSLPTPQFQCGAGVAVGLCANTLNNLTFNNLNITWSLDGFAFSLVGTNTLRVDDGTGPLDLPVSLNFGKGRQTWSCFLGSCNQYNYLLYAYVEMDADVNGVNYVVSLFAGSHFQIPGSYIEQICIDGPGYSQCALQ